MKISEIRIEGRHRKSLGDLEGLARSISERGLLHPVAVTADGQLIAGERRIAAMRLLGFDEVPVTVIHTIDDALALHKAERDENACRENFLPTEAVDVGRTIEAMEREAAKERQAATQFKNGQPPSGSGNFPEPLRGDTRDKVGAAVGMSGRTYEKAAQVVEAAEAEPEVFGDLAEKMDRTKSVDRAHKELKRRKERQKNKALVDLAPSLNHVTEERYQTIVIDPPWHWGDEGDVSQFGRGDPTYHTMPIEEIAALPVADLSQDNAHIYLWITNRSLPKGFALLEKWGFRYITAITWCKPSIGMGNYFRGSSEQVLFGVRGSLPLLRRDVGTWFEAKRGPDGHSSKPDEFYKIVESCSPGPRLDMFSRRHRPGWVSWGAEAWQNTPSRAV